MDKKDRLYNRKNPRLDDFDYTKGSAFFITVCAKDRAFIFSDITYSEIGLTDISPVNDLTEYGQLIKESLENINTFFPGVYIDEYVVMPNHFHFIIFVDRIKTSVSVSSIVGRLKSVISKKSSAGTKSNKIFQRSFYDRIIRSDEELYHLRRYIIDNPKKWAFDEYYNK